MGLLDLLLDEFLTGDLERDLDLLFPGDLDLLFFGDLERDPEYLLDRELDRLLAVTGDLECLLLTGDFDLGGDTDMKRFLFDGDSDCLRSCDRESLRSELLLRLGDVLPLALLLCRGESCKRYFSEILTMELNKILYTLILIMWALTA